MPIFEDDCYADLIWDGQRPPAIHAMDRTGGVIHIGSFSKSIAPALRVGFIVAPWQMLSRMLALKTDAGSGALEQMVLAEYCAPHFSSHVPKLTRGLRAKLDTLMEALNEQFGTAAEFDDPRGGIFLWVKLPDQVDTLKLYQAALAAGVAINPGPEWCTDKAYAGSRLRLCFASPSHQQIREGVAVLAEVCRREFGVPARSANIEKRGPMSILRRRPHGSRRRRRAIPFEPQRRRRSRRPTHHEGLIPTAVGVDPPHRRGRARPGHPRLLIWNGFEDVDARNKCGHDKSEMWPLV